MITKVEIDGFKTFKNFKVELAPFQVIVGQNGVGKSNLFDALNLLRGLTDANLTQMFEASRGEALELFAALPGGKSTSRIWWAVEVLVDREIQDEFGRRFDLKYTRLRYELEVIRCKSDLGLDRLCVTHELLKPIPRSEDDWAKKNLSSHNIWLGKSTNKSPLPFIDTDHTIENPTIILRKTERASTTEKFIAGKIERIVLSSVTTIDYPYAYAVRNEMLNWNFLNLNPIVLREPWATFNPSTISPVGHYLPNTLVRMQAEDKYALNDVSLDLANLVPDIVKVEVEPDQAKNQYTLKVVTQDNRSFSSRVLSDGTLKMLALVTLKNDPDQKGVLFMEEPENGVHPFRLRKLVEILHRMATDFSDPEQATEPLRQIIINTHSPVFVSQLVNLEAEQTNGKVHVTDELLFAYNTTVSVEVAGVNQRLRVTRMVPPKPSPEVRQNLDIEEPETYFTVAQIINYLDSADAGQTRANFQKAVAK